MQEQEIAKKQQAAQERLINNLMSESEGDIKDVGDWIKKLEDCIGSSNNMLPDDLNNVLNSLNDFNRAAPDVNNFLIDGKMTICIY